MVDLSLSILFSITILVFFRLLKPVAGATLQIITLNYLVASLLGIATAGPIATQELFPLPGWIPVAVVLGFLFISTFFLFALSSQQVGVALTAVASRMSVFIPVLAGLLLFGERASLVRWVGLLLVFPAFYYTLYIREKKKDLRLSHALLPLALLVGTGMNDLLMNFVSRAFAPLNLSVMLATTFGIAFVIGTITLSISIFMFKGSFRTSLIPASILLGLINFASTFFLMRSMSHFDAILLFPVINASIVILAALVDRIFFGHRPNRQQVAGLALSVLAIILITRG
jgi:drug/metabolite transporter (DMT)-like permease